MIHAVFEGPIEFPFAVLHLALNLGDLGLEFPAFQGEGLGGKNGALANQFLIVGAQVFFLLRHLLLIGLPALLDLRLNIDHGGRILLNELIIQDGDPRVG